MTAAGRELLSMQNSLS